MGVAAEGAMDRLPQFPQSCFERLSVADGRYIAYRDVVFRFLL